MRTSLTSQGYDVLEAEDGKMAIDMARRNAIDAIVLDLGLPNADGFGSDPPVARVRLRRS